jgi:hypothetical protein
MDSSTSQALADAIKLNNDLSQLVEKLTIQLNEKDKELQDNKQENEVNAYFNGTFLNIKLHYSRNCWQIRSWKKLKQLKLQRII